MQRIITAAMVFAALGASVLQGDTPPQGSKPLSAVLKAVTSEGYEAVTEVSFDDGEWEVEVLKDGRAIGLRVSPDSAKVRHEYPDEPHPRLPSSAKALIEIVKSLEQDGFDSIRKAEFEAGRWEVEAHSSQGWRELKVDPQGRILSNRIDD